MSDVQTSARARRVYSWIDRRWYVVSAIGRTVPEMQGPPPVAVHNPHANWCATTMTGSDCDCGFWPKAAT